MGEQVFYFPNGGKIELTVNGSSNSFIVYQDLVFQALGTSFYGNSISLEEKLIILDAVKSRLMLGKEQK